MAGTPFWDTLYKRPFSVTRGAHYSTVTNKNRPQEHSNRGYITSSLDIQAFSLQCYSLSLLIPYSGQYIIHFAILFFKLFVLGKHKIERNFEKERKEKVRD